MLERDDSTTRCMACVVCVKRKLAGNDESTTTVNELVGEVETPEPSEKRSKLDAFCALKGNIMTKKSIISEPILTTNSSVISKRKNCPVVT